MLKNAAYSIMNIIIIAKKDWLYLSGCQLKIYQDDYYNLKY